ncbi:MAG: NAD(P)/FAD-dependent oxidoreductase [Cyanobacteria bacterium P01_E01_bin.42]
MPVEYDLVIIGYTPEGVRAALNAVSLRARVALVSQNCSGSCKAFYSYALRNLGQQCYQRDDAPKLGLLQSTDEIDLTQESARIDRAIATIAEQNSPAVLSAAGVDFIEGTGEFCRRPHLALIVGERKLRSRSYLLTTGTNSLLPQNESLQEVGYLTPDLLWRSCNLQQLPQTLAIVGGTPLALELAQSLTRLGKKVTLIIEGQFLASEEPEATRIIQARLEIEGISILTHSPVTQAQTIEQKKWLQVGDRAIEVDEIIWAVGEGLNLEHLNLEGLGIDPQNPHVNSKLQTRHPQIYLCSGLEEGYELPHLSQYQADIALDNALFVPRKISNLDRIARVVFTNPTLTRIGATEWEARQKHGDRILVYHHHFKQVARAILEEEMTGVFKIILDCKGRILGATIVGKEAEEVIHLLAFAIQNRSHINRLAELSAIAPSFSETIAQIAREWQRDRIRKNTFGNAIRRFWLTWRRGN